MENRGRKSSTALAVVSVDVARKRLEPPASLKPQEKVIFHEVVASCDPSQFRASDLPMLTAFCTATYLSRFYADLIGEDPAAFQLWQETTKLQISLATKLRLTPRARIEAKWVTRHEPRTGKGAVGMRLTS